ncbi:hypothetical protein P7C70_g4444, partial [Phenoliferia sp. Uapishka_3]
METTRPHLDRAHGDVEQGVADVLTDRVVRHAAPHAAPPNWLIRWETWRPMYLTECVAEMIGVFFYVYSGIGASASFYVTSAAKVAGFGSLLTIGASYGAGIVFAIIIAAPVSGGHLSPSFTLCFWMFKGFPGRKAWRYVLAQILGGFFAALAVYGQYKQPFDEIHASLVAAGEGAVNFSTNGPASVLALFPQVTQAGDLRYVFLNEFICNVFLAILVFCVIDGSNFLIAPAISPVIIGAGYAVIIWGFASQSIALNIARDVGGRMACGVIYGRGCFTTYPGYTALAALTTLPASTLFLGDTDRVLVNLPPGVDREALGLQGGEPLTMRSLTRERINAEKGSPDVASNESQSFMRRRNSFSKSATAHKECEYESDSRSRGTPTESR